MAIDSVSSTSNAYTPPPQAQPRTEQAERPEPAQARAPEAQPPQRDEQPQPQPVTNLQGQRTGSIINTSA